MRSVPRAWLVAGYASAHDRYKEASQHPGSPDLLFIPLFEALNWAGALEENLRPHTDPLLWAVRFVRNQVLHEWADAVEGRTHGGSQEGRFELERAEPLEEGQLFTQLTVIYKVRRVLPGNVNG